MEYLEDGLQGPVWLVWRVSLGDGRQVRRADEALTDGVYAVF